MIEKIFSGMVFSLGRDSTAEPHKAYFVPTIHHFTDLLIFSDGGYLDFRFGTSCVERIDVAKRDNASFASL